MPLSYYIFAGAGVLLLGYAAWCSRDDELSVVAEDTQNLLSSE